MIDYTEAVKIFNEMLAKVKLLEDEYDLRMKAAYTEEEVSKVFNPSHAFISRILQTYPEAPSENAVFCFSSDDADFYEVKVNDTFVSECVFRKDKKE